MLTLSQVHPGSSTSYSLTSTQPFASCLSTAPTLPPLLSQAQTSLPGERKTEFRDQYEYLLLLKYWSYFQISFHVHRRIAGHKYPPVICSGSSWLFVPVLRIRPWWLSLPMSGELAERESFFTVCLISSSLVFLMTSLRHITWYLHSSRAAENEWASSKTHTRDLLIFLPSNIIRIHLLSL